MENPYAPTHVNLEAPNKQGVAGFWLRFAALLIDGLISLPLVIAGYVISSLSRQGLMFWQGIMVLFSFWFYIYLVVRFGGTPGKRLLKMSIKMKDGSKLSGKATLFRYSVALLVVLSSALSHLIALSRMTDQSLLDLDFMTRDLAIAEHAPGFNQPIIFLYYAWLIASAITMLCNKERRAVHDYIAGTVVIRNDA